MLLQRLVDSKQEVPRKFRFSPSALPYCGLKHLWHHLYESSGRQVKEDETFMRSFYLEVGRAVHRVVQHWLADLGIIYGYWRCRNAVSYASDAFPSEKRACFNLEMVGPCLPPPQCKCGSPMQYEEMKVSYEPTHFNGFVDGLVQIPHMNFAEDEFAIAEVKTTSTRKLADQKKPGGLSREYFMQGMVYAHLLREMGYKIRGVLYILVPRDAPHKTDYIWIDKQVRFASGTFHAMMQQFTDTQTAKQTLEYGGISGSCITIADAEYCPFKQNCFNPNGLDLFERMHIRATQKAPLSLPVLPS